MQRSETFLYTKGKHTEKEFRKSKQTATSKNQSTHECKIPLLWKLKNMEEITEDTRR